MKQCTIVSRQEADPAIDDHGFEEPDFRLEILATCLLNHCKIVLRRDKQHVGSKPCVYNFASRKSGASATNKACQQSDFREQWTPLADSQTT